MSHWASKYEIIMMSKADYEGGVGHSSVKDDFPFEPGPDVLFDHLTGQKLFVGRDPATEYPLIVPEFDRYTSTVATHGVAVAHEGVALPYGVPPDVCSLRCEVTSAGIIADIDAVAKHLVYGVRNVTPGEAEDNLPPGLEPYYIHSVIPTAKWDEIKTELLARGVAQNKIDWFEANYPEPTPVDLEYEFNRFASNQ